MRAPRFREGIAAALLLALVALPLACGGSGRLSKPEYEQQVNGAGERLSSVFSLVDQNNATLRQFAVKVDRARAQLDGVTRNLADVKPPKAAEPAHDELVGALRVLSGDLRSLAAAARSGSRRRTDLARSGLSAPAREILRAIQQLQQAGFDVNRGASG